MGIISPDHQWQVSLPLSPYYRHSPLPNGPNNGGRLDVDDRGMVGGGPPWSHPGWGGEGMAVPPASRPLPPNGR